MPWRTLSSPRVWSTQTFVAERCEDFEQLGRVHRPAREQPRGHRDQSPEFRLHELRAAARLYAAGPNSAIYYGLGVTEHSQGSTMVMGMANLAMATGNIGHEGVGVNPLRGQNNVQGSCDMGSFPHELPGYRHVSDDAVRHVFEDLWGQHDPRRARTAHPQHVRRRHRRHVPRALRPG